MANKKPFVDLLTLEQAMELYENGLALEVNKGQEIKIVREKEPTSPSAN